MVAVILRFHGFIYLRYISILNEKEIRKKKLIKKEILNIYTEIIVFIRCDAFL